MTRRRMSLGLDQPLRPVNAMFAVARTVDP